MRNLHIEEISLFIFVESIFFKFERFCKLRDSLNMGLNRFSNVSLVHILRLFPHHPRGKSHWRIVFFLSGCSPIGISFHLNNYFWCFRNWYWWWNEYSFEDEEEMMQILFASWFKGLKTSTTDDEGHWLNPFDSKSQRLLRMMKRRCRFYLMRANYFYPRLALSSSKVYLLKQGMCRIMVDHTLKQARAKAGSG